MPHYVIDIHHHTRPRPDTGQPRVVHTRRTLIAAEPGGPCTRPVTITSGALTTRVACARALPVAQQCPACRITITIRHTTTTHHDGQPPGRPAFGGGR